MFVKQTESADWAETLIGRVIQPLTTEFTEQLQWFWFSRYVCLIETQGEDRGDCDFNAIPDDFKQAFPGTNHPGHRSLRFRFEVEDDHQEAFEARLHELIAQHGYAISDLRDYGLFGDLGGDRFLGVENQQPGRDIQRARLVAHLFQDISQLVIDTLVGPDPANRFHIERNLQQQNPNGSTFESLHHLFCNITLVPVSVLLGTENQTQIIRTYWGPPRWQRTIARNGQPFTEVYLSY
jgi:hypothetical protein